MTRPTKEHVKSVCDEIEDLDLPDGAHWALIHERLGLEYGDVFDYFAQDPAYFGSTTHDKTREQTDSADNESEDKCTTNSQSKPGSP